MAPLRKVAPRVSMLVVGTALAACSGAAPCATPHPADDAATDAAPVVDRPAQPLDVPSFDVPRADAGAGCDDLQVFTSPGAPGCGQPVPTPQAGPTAGMMRFAVWRRSRESQPRP